MNTRNLTWKQRAWIVAGTLCVGLGVLGMILPLMPTTVFLLAAAACYSRGSDRFLHWLLNNRYFGAYIRNYREGRGMPLREKILTISLLWVSMGFSAFLIRPSVWVLVLLAVVAGGVTTHLLRIKTYIPPVEPLEAEEASPHPRPNLTLVRGEGPPPSRARASGE